MTDEEVEELMLEVARLDAVHDEVLKSVLTEFVEAALAEGPGESIAGGVQPLVNILNRSDPTSSQVLLTQLEHTNPELADEVRRRMFIFSDIVKLDDRAVQLVLREVDAKDLALALKGTSP